MQDLWDDQGRLKPTDELRQLFAAAGVKPGDVVVAYCHIGIFANTVLTAARILGYDVRLYDGSFQDWVARARPLTTAKTTDN
jgi:thiosulfate/3-mercaptopyruvate sulfurtransferase